MARYKKQPQPRVSVDCLNNLYFGKLMCRAWTYDLKAPTHCAILNRTPDFPQSVAGVFFKCKDENEAVRRTHEARQKKQFGHTFYFVNEYGHTFGYTVHFPRFESEDKNGFINFHCFNAIRKINTGMKFKIIPCDDHARHKKNFL